MSSGPLELAVNHTKVCDDCNHVAVGHRGAVPLSHPSLLRLVVAIALTLKLCDIERTFPSSCCVIVNNIVAYSTKSPKSSSLICYRHIAISHRGIASYSQSCSLGGMNL